MYWNHAKSRDLLHWETSGIALFPDETGTMYSGCCFPDKAGTAGFGKDALLFYYTAAGGNNPWSLEEPFTQRLAVSRDGGATLEKKECVLPHLAGENRDPMVFRHEPSGAFCMVLYLEENTFALFRSLDLLCWEETQRLSLPGAWECPALFPLSTEEGPEKWVFWSADGFYFLGSFDGFRFTPDSPRREAYLNAVPYAAQIFSGIPGRTVQMTWLRLPNGGKEFTGAMALPAELSLAEREGELFLRTRPAVDWEALGIAPVCVPPEEDWREERPEGPFLLETEARTSLKLFQNGREILRLSPERGEVCLGTERGEAPRFRLEGSLQFIADRGVLELRLAGGLSWIAAPGPDSLKGTWELRRGEKDAGEPCLE